MSEESDVAQRKVTVSNFLVKKDKISALKAALENPPLKSEELKEENVLIIESVMNTISESEIPKLLESLELEKCDILMKYIYKLMGRSSNCSLMLKMHANLVKKAGHGSIVRVMSDRKQV